MLWRKFKLDWQYAIGELVIVTAGVLIALWIQQWNDNRLEREEERNILARLSSDLSQDAETIEFLHDRSSTKFAALSRIRTQLEEGPTAGSHRQLLEDIGLAANLGWNIPQSANDTFEEIRSAGKFGLINDPAIRGQISRYYRNFATMFIRSDARETGFPMLSYQLIPRGQQSADMPGILSPLVSGLSDAEVEALVERVFASDLEDYVIAEANLALFIGALTTNLDADHKALTQAIRSYRITLD